MNTHAHYMHIALELAKKGLGSVSPNPMVGCVIVKDGVIIGEGYHQQYGGLHAEPNAVNSVANREDIKGADVYVTLEPCSHFGKTPPCANLLVDLKPKRVIIANIDTNPLVQGKGIKLLEEAGIEVITGVLAEEAKALNKRFFTFMEQKRPYIILKWAESQDGFLALPNYKATQISGSEAMIYAHQMRADEDAILVGFNTALYDNPSLTTRLVEGSNPLRLFIDKRLELPKTHHLLDKSTPSACFNLEKDDSSEINLEYVKLDCLHFNLEILEYLYNRKISSLIVEGGTKLLQSFIDSNLWDEAIVFNSKIKLNSGVKSPEINIPVLKKEVLGEDIKQVYLNKKK